MEDNGVMTVSVIPQYKPLIAEFKDIDKLSSSDFNRELIEEKTSTS